ncbi:MAG: OmpA family protein [Proteobacteria bacterium]|nr:OmpA family protein [Pseudomonadota bacterium]
MSKTIFSFVAIAVFFSSLAHTQDFDSELMEAELKEGKALILVTVEDNRGKPMEGVIVSVQQGLRKKPFSRVSDKKGRVELIVSAGFTYRLRFLSLDVSQNTHVEKFDIPDEEDLRYSLVMTYTAPKSKVFVLEGVLFNTGKATLKSSSFGKLATLLEYLTMKTSVEIELSGHTDNVGNDEANQKLSEARAESVRKYLIKKGIAGRRITAVGYGESSPIDSNDTAAGRKKNRRTEVRILSE